ncbi:MAG: hypothetical protein MZV63_72440 [Marinilabiliales bacterium]|nr:hypothetical protein [Marinilabiliales bacterium]
MLTILEPLPGRWGGLLPRPAPDQPDPAADRQRDGLAGGDRSLPAHHQGPGRGGGNLVIERGKVFC